MSEHGGGKEDNKDEDELIKLLDEALDDFKMAPKTSDDDLDEFMQKVDQEATNKAAENFQSMLAQMLDSMQKEEGQQQQISVASTSKTTANSSSVTKSLSDLLFNEAAGEQEISEALEKLPISRGSLDDLMETIIQTAVSKEAMYPAIKELHEKFQPYLEQKKDELDPETLLHYKEQYRILSLLLDLYNEDVNPDNVAKEARASKIANLWMEMQKHGLPPPELSNNLHASSSEKATEEKMNDCSIM